MRRLREVVNPLFHRLPPRSATRIFVATGKRIRELPLSKAGLA